MCRGRVDGRLGELDVSDSEPARGRPTELAPLNLPRPQRRHSRHPLLGPSTDTDDER